MCFIQMLTKEKNGGDQYEPEQTKNHITVWSLEQITRPGCMVSLGLYRNKRNPSVDRHQ